MRFLRARIHLLTAIILQIVLGVLIWANVRTWTAFYGLKSDPYEYGLDKRGVAYASHFHGWPWMCCERAEYSDATLYHWNYPGLVKDVCVSLAIIAITAFVIERLLYPPGATKAEATK